MSHTPTKGELMEEITIKFDEETKLILGQPNFAVAKYAHRRRELGEKIETKAEAEQAHVLFWWLSLYAKHGKNWWDEMIKELKLPPATPQPKETP